MNIKSILVSFLLLANSTFAMDKKTGDITDKPEEYKKFLQALFIESQATPAPAPKTPPLSPEDGARLQERYAKINNQKKKTMNAKYHK